MTAPEPAFVDVRGLSVTYRSGHSQTHAVENVDLSLQRGESLGIVGESGCGKSTLGLALMRLLPENTEVSLQGFHIAGRDIGGADDREFRREVRWKTISMIYQSAMASLNPVLRVGNQLVSAYRLHNPKAPIDQARAKVESLFDLVGIPRNRLRAYPHEYSGGMQQRAVIAMSLVADPQFVIADEATTALDVVVQRQILDALNELRSELGLTMIVISHDMGAIATICDRVSVMYAGQIVETNRLDNLVTSPQHPYTASLMAAIPSLEGPRKRLVSLPGTPPDLSDPPSACRFANRCPIVQDVCREVDPSGNRAEDGSPVRCHFPGTILSTPRRGGK